MRPPAITAVLLTLLFVLLSACGSNSAQVIQNSPTTYSVSAEYGSAFGGMDLAKYEATAKATQFCERTGKQVALRDEQRSSGSLSGAQKSTITFECVPDPSSTGEGGLKGNQQGDYNVGDKMILNAKRMAAIKKCTDGIKFNSDRYAACMAKEGESP